MSDILEWKEAYNSMLEQLSKAHVPKPKKLRPVGTGALLDEQQHCYDKGYKDGVKALRAAIRMRLLQ